MQHAETRLGNAALLVWTASVADATRRRTRDDDHSNETHQQQNLNSSSHTVRMTGLTPELSEVAVSAAPTARKPRKNQAHETAGARHFRSSDLVRRHGHLALCFT
jgi:hypothetical protein